MEALLLTFARSASCPLARPLVGIPLGKTWLLV